MKIAHARYRDKGPLSVNQLSTAVLTRDIKSN